MLNRGLTLEHQVPRNAVNLEIRVVTDRTPNAGRIVIGRKKRLTDSIQAFKDNRGFKSRRFVFVQPQI